MGDKNNNNNAEKFVLQSLTTALEKKANGIDRDYNRTITALEASPVSTLVFWFRALVKCISLLDKDCHALINILLRYQYDAGPEANNAFERMILHLISINQCFVSSICEKFVLEMIPALEADKIERSYEVGNIAVKMIITMVTSFPATASTLFPYLEKHFPHKVSPIHRLDRFSCHLLQIASNAVILRERILNLLAARMLEIDVEISVHEDENEAEMEGDDLIFQLEESNPLEPPSRTAEMAGKLDIMMCHYFSFLDQQFLENELDSCNELMSSMLKVFDNTILPSHKSKYVQFLIFYACSRNQNYPQQFIALLLQKIVDDYTSNIVKECAVAYIGSFLARADYIGSQLLHSTLVTLCTAAVKYSKAQDEFSAGDLVKHSIFYHLCQTIFYIFCYRMESSLDRMTREECLSSYLLVTIVQSKLNPCKICSPFIVKEFRDISAELKVNRLTQALDEAISKNDQILHRIDASFPFDPYLLKNSSTFVTPIYASWDESDVDESSYSEEFGSLPDENDLHYLSFTPDSGFDMDNYSHSPMGLY